MKRFLTIAVLLLSLNAHSAPITFTLTNYFESPFTNNTVRVFPVADPILANGSYTITGLPIRLTMNTNTGVATTNLLQGNYLLTNTSPKIAILFAVPEGDDAYTYEELAISGFNTYNYSPGVQKLIAGSGISLSPTNGKGNVTITVTNSALNYVTNNNGTVSNSLTVLGNLSVTTNLTVNSAVFTNAVTNLALTASRFMTTDANNKESSTGTSAYLLNTLSDATGGGGGLGVVVFNRNPTLVDTTLSGEFIPDSPGGANIGNSSSQFNNVYANRFRAKIGNEGYIFDGDDDTGMRRSAADTLAFDAGGSTRVRILTDRARFSVGITNESYYHGTGNFTNTAAMYGAASGNDIKTHTRFHFANRADTAVPDAENETTLTNATATGTTTIPANYLTEGTIIEVEMAGNQSTIGATTITFSLELNGTVLAAGNLTDPDEASPSIWRTVTTVRTTGASGSFETTGTLINPNNFGITHPFGTATIDTTVSQTIDLTVTSGAAGNGFTCKNLIVKITRP